MPYITLQRKIKCYGKLFFTSALAPCKVSINMLLKHIANYFNQILKPIAMSNTSTDDKYSSQNVDCIPLKTVIQPM